MDIVYPYDGKDNLTIGIGASIRSMRKFYAGIGAVWVLGPPPGADGVNVIRVADDTGEAHRNVVKKYSVAAQTASISDPFMVVSDDVIATAPFSDPPFYCRGECAHHHGGSSYDRSVRETGTWLTQRGHTSHNFETHTPRVLHKERVARTLCSYPWQDKKLQFFTIYGNMNDVEWVHGRNAKEIRPGDAAEHPFISFGIRCNRKLREQVKEMLDADNQTCA